MSVCRRLAGRLSARIAGLSAAVPLIVVAATLLATWFLMPAPTAYASLEISPITVGAVYPSGQPLPPAVTATAALVLDADSGLVLYSKDAGKRLPMASTTKIMTAILVLESLDLETKVMVSRNAHFQTGSVVGLQALEVVTVEQLLYGLLVPSGNDAAVALAEETSGSVAKFVAKMNQRAQAMGLTNTRFQNPSGLGATNHYSSCTDLATMAREAMKNPLFRKIVDTPVYYLPHPTPGASPRELKNSNVLLTKYDWVNGVKTGNTPNAGYGVVASGTREGVSLLVVLLGAKDDPTRWSEVEALFDYGFGTCPLTALAEPNRLLAEVPLGDPLDLHVDLVPSQRLVTRLRQTEVATGKVSLSHELTLPIRGGDLLGAVEFRLNGKSLGSVDLVAQQAVYPPTVRDMLVKARCWYLPELVLSESGEGHLH
jgi:D-alanyl-D-alanine carboxypeptidase (penicillin-binding protein 5/6)